MIEDLMTHGRLAGARVHRIEVDTPLVPRAVAEGVLEESCVYLAEPLPRRWIRELIAHANTVYANNAQFRRRLRAGGDAGRDWLWIFTRHWLAALIWKRRRRLYRQLPGTYCVGNPLAHRPQVDAR